MNVLENIASNLMLFDGEKEKFKRLEMAEKLVKKTTETATAMSGPLIDSLTQVFTESQQWKQLIDLLVSVNNGRNEEIENKTINYLKKNLLYCFEPQTRNQLKEQIEKLETAFTSKNKVMLA